MTVFCHIFVTDRFLTDIRHISDRFMNMVGPTLTLSTLNSFFALLIAKRQRQILESEKETLGSFHVGHLRRVRWSFSWEYLIIKCARKLGQVGVQNLNV